MGSTERYDAFAILQRAMTDERALGEALSLFIERPDYGFLWLAYEDGAPVGCITATLGIDLTAGGIVATVRDLYVVPERRRRGIGSALLVTLHGRLAQLDVARIDALGGSDPALRPFFLARSYRAAGQVFTRLR